MTELMHYDVVDEFRFEMHKLVAETEVAVSRT
jgi:hypothetical protein